MHFSEPEMAEENYLQNALMPVCAKEQQIVEVMEPLQMSLKQMPAQIIGFRCQLFFIQKTNCSLILVCSLVMRILHNQSAVSGEHEGASKFLKLRDQTRRNALIYTDTLLPKSDDVVRKIKEYTYDIKACDFEDWQESLEEITEEGRLATS